jgi:recombination protein RecT
MQQAETYTTSTTPQAIEAQKQERAKEEKAIVRISNYLDAPTVKARFASVVGNADAYISSVMITVRESKQLQECQPESIYLSALRAATLKLSTDPATGQAYIVPFKGRATLIVGYKGLYDMAVRTGKYRYINVGPIYEGQEVEENQITGFHSIKGTPTNKDHIIGWIGAFEMNPERGQTTGFGKTFYMTVEEIHEHAEAYSKGYGTPNKDGILVDYKGKPTIWHTEVHKMERKTVMRLMLRRWGYLNPTDAQTLEEIEAEQEPIDVESSDVYSPNMPNIPEYDEAADEHKRTTSENLEQLGFN